MGISGTSGKGSRMIKSADIWYDLTFLKLSVGKPTLGPFFGYGGNHALFNFDL